MNPWTETLLRCGDYLLGWLLYLPRDIRLIALAVLTSLLLSIVKKAVADREWLSRAKCDLKRLKALLKNARKEKDSESLERYRYTRAMIQLKQLRYELKTLAWVMLPLLLIGSWSWHRMEFEPPTKDSSFEVILRTPASSIGQVAYLVPNDATHVDNWVKPIVQSGNSAYPGIAIWSVTPSPISGMARLSLRSGNNTYEQPVLTGGRYYQVPQFTQHGEGWRTELKMREVKLFGVLPGVRRLGFPPWVTAYVLLVVLLLPISRRCFRVR